MNWLYYNDVKKSNIKLALIKLKKKFLHKYSSNKYKYKFIQRHTYKSKYCLFQIILFGNKIYNNNNNNNSND